MKRPLIVACVSLLLSAFASPARAGLIHYYELNGNGNDQLGGPAVVPSGGSGGAFNATSYTFQLTSGSNKNGLTLTGGLPSGSGGTYSILIDYQYSSAAGYQKLIDFNNLTDDQGLYLTGGSLLMFNITSTPTANPVNSNTLTRIVLTRDSTTKQLTGYVNGVQQFSVTDSGDLGVFSNAGPDVLMNFFNDDNTHGGGETATGFADRIAIYNSALSSGDVATLGGPGELSAVPEPGPMALLGAVFALGALGHRVRRLFGTRPAVA